MGRKRLFPGRHKDPYGTIRLTLREGASGGSSGSHGQTTKGAIYAGDKAAGTKTGYGTEYELPSESPVIIRLESERGNILLD